MTASTRVWNTRSARATGPELDGLVDLDSHVLVIEAKSHALHDSYRRGDIERLGYHIEDLIHTPLRQSARAANYLLEGGTRFRAASGGNVVEIRAVDSVTRIIVSLERMDPIALIANDIPHEDQARGGTAWIVSIPDLLAVCEIIDSPHLLAAYAQLRSWFAETGNATIFTEMDFLGAFLDDRLRDFAFAVTADDPMDVVALAQHSQEINRYYTATAAGMEVPKPGIQIDDDLSATLMTLYEDRNRAGFKRLCQKFLGATIQYTIVESRIR